MRNMSLEDDFDTPAQQAQCIKPMLKKNATLSSTEELTLTDVSIMQRALDGQRLDLAFAHLYDHRGPITEESPR